MSILATRKIKEKIIWARDNRRGLPGLLSGFEKLFITSMARNITEFPKTYLRTCDVVYIDRIYKKIKKAKEQLDVRTQRQTKTEKTSEAAEGKIE